MLKTATLSFCLITSLMVAGCGNTQDQRTLTGAGFGAGGGALLGAVAGFNPLVGAAVGGVGGAVVGANSK